MASRRPGAAPMKRNPRQEQAAQTPLRRYFQEDNNHVFFLEGEEAAYHFLADVLDTFHAYGEVYVSQRLGTSRSDDQSYSGHFRF